MDRPAPPPPGVDPLVAFIRARIAEERADAEAAPHGPWDWVAVGKSGYPQRVTNGAAKIIAQCYENPDFPASCATHIARQDPAATLARCDALERLVQPHQPEGGEYPSGPWCERCWGQQSDTQESWPCDVIRGVAAIWWIGPDGKRHPDWREEWAPAGFIGA